MVFQVRPSTNLAASLRIFSVLFALFEVSTVCLHGIFELIGTNALLAGTTISFVRHVTDLFMKEIINLALLATVRV